MSGRPILGPVRAPLPEGVAFSLDTCKSPFQAVCPETPGLQAFLRTDTLRIEVKSSYHTSDTSDSLVFIFPVSVPERP